MLDSELLCGLEALVGEGWRHPDVEDDRVEVLRPKQGGQLGDGADGAYDLDTGLLQEQSESASDQRAVVDDHEPHESTSSLTGRRASTVVPAWALDTMLKR